MFPVIFLQLFNCTETEATKPNGSLNHIPEQKEREAADALILLSTGFPVSPTNDEVKSRQKRSSEEDPSHSKRQCWELAQTPVRSDQLEFDTMEPIDLTVQESIKSVPPSMSTGSTSNPGFSATLKPKKKIKTISEILGISKQALLRVDTIQKDIAKRQKLIDIIETANKQRESFDKSNKPPFRSKIYEFEVLVRNMHRAGQCIFDKFLENNQLDGWSIKKKIFKRIVDEQFQMPEPRKDSFWFLAHSTNTQEIKMTHELRKFFFETIQREHPAIFSGDIETDSNTAIYKDNTIAGLISSIEKGLEVCLRHVLKNPKGASHLATDRRPEISILNDTIIKLILYSVREFGSDIEFWSWIVNPYERIFLEFLQKADHILKSVSEELQQSASIDYGKIQKIFDDNSFKYNNNTIKKELFDMKRIKIRIRSSESSKQMECILNDKRDRAVFLGWMHARAKLLVTVMNELKVYFGSHFYCKNFTKIDIPVLILYTFLDPSRVDDCAKTYFPEFERALSRNNLVNEQALSY